VGAYGGQWGLWSGAWQQQAATQVLSATGLVAATHGSGRQPAGTCTVLIHLANPQGLGDAAAAAGEAAAAGGPATQHEAALSAAQMQAAVQAVEGLLQAASADPATWACEDLVGRGWRWLQLPGRAGTLSYLPRRLAQDQGLVYSAFTALQQDEEVGVELALAATNTLLQAMSGTESWAAYSQRELATQLVLQLQHACSRWTGHSDEEVDFFYGSSAAARTAAMAVVRLDALYCNRQAVVEGAGSVRDTAWWVPSANGYANDPRLSPLRHVLQDNLVDRKWHA
jgi:hypothetical protein